MVIGVLLFVCVAFFAVPAAAVFYRYRFAKKNPEQFDLSTYLAAWALVAVLEIVVVVGFSGEPTGIVIVGFWSTVGAVVVGGIWALISRSESREQHD